MGSSKHEDQQSQTTNTLDPWVKGLLSQNLAQSDKVTNAPFQGYGADRFAGFTPAQTQAQGMLTNLATDSAANGTDTLGNAINAAKATSGYQPLSVTAPTASSQGYSAATYNPTLLNPGDIAKFENPYTQQVVDATSADAQHALQVQQNQNNSNMTKLGAWRGSAGAVENGVATGDTNRSLIGTIADLRDRGFNAAAGLAGGNVAAQNAASQYNAGATNTASEFGAGAANAAALENARSILSASQGNQQAGLTANVQNQEAAKILAAMSGQQLTQGAQDAGLLATVGDQQQQQQQQQKDFDYNEFLRKLAYPIQMQQLRNASMGLVPAIQNSSSTGSSDVTTSGGLLGTLGQVAGIGASLGKLFALSDERAKKDVTTSGFDAKGRRWVDYRYLWDSPDTPKRAGLLAQDTLRTDPQAVVREPSSGLLGIDYAKLSA